MVKLHGPKCRVWGLLFYFDSSGPSWNYSRSPETLRFSASALAIVSTFSKGEMYLEISRSSLPCPSPLRSPCRKLQSPWNAWLRCSGGVEAPSQKQPVNTDSSPVLNGDPAKMWRVSPVSTEAWLLGSQTKYLLWIKPDCWTIVTVAPQVLRSPRFSAPVCDLQHQQWAVPKQAGLQVPSAILRTFPAWTGQFTRGHKKKVKWPVTFTHQSVKVCHQILNPFALNLGSSNQVTFMENGLITTMIQLISQPNSDPISVKPQQTSAKSAKSSLPDGTIVKKSRKKVMFCTLKAW